MVFRLSFHCRGKFSYIACVPDTALLSHALQENQVSVILGTHHLNEPDCVPAFKLQHLFSEKWSKLYIPERVALKIQ